MRSDLNLNNHLKLKTDTWGLRENTHTIHKLAEKLELSGKHIPLDTKNGSDSDINSLLDELATANVIIVIDSQLMLQKHHVRPSPGESEAYELIIRNNCWKYTLIMVLDNYLASIIYASLLNL